MTGQYYRDWRRILSQLEIIDGRRNITTEELGQLYKHLKLRMFTTHPLKTLSNDGCIMKQCRDYGNPQAHYIEGIVQYFQCNRTGKGLFHLEQAAKGLYDDRIYFYGLLLLCRGNIEEGINKLASLGWETNTERVDTCWKHIRKSLSEITVVIKERYRINMQRVMPVWCRQKAAIATTWTTGASSVTITSKWRNSFASSEPQCSRTTIIKKKKISQVPFVFPLYPLIFADSVSVLKIIRFNVYKAYIPALQITRTKKMTNHQCQITRT